MSDPAQFTTLPYEIRLMIYELVFPSPKEPMLALKTLGFRNPHIESPSPNVAIRLPAGALMDLYNSNPAGSSKGRFWRPLPLLAVSKQLKEEASGVWNKLPVVVNTWMSFLSNRPLDQLSRIDHVDFKYFITLSWSPSNHAPQQAMHPQPQRQLSLSDWVASIADTWSQGLERLSAMMPSEHLPRLSVDLSLIHPTVYTYRLRAGINREMLAWLKEILPVVMEEALEGFREEGKWPEQGVIVDGMEEWRVRHLLLPERPLGVTGV